jgi:hypothetical protein
VPDITVELPRILIEASKAELHATGAVPRPQVHMFAEDMSQPYAGFVTCRRFYRGWFCSAVATAVVRDRRPHRKLGAVDVRQF